jgi:hypothetical protein
MTSAANSERGDSAPSGPSANHRWTLTSLVLRHKRVAAVSIVIVLGAVAATLITTVSSPSRQPLSDSASCTQWAAASPGQKIDYAHLYINEYGRFANTAGNAASVEKAIDRQCTKASYLGEADDMSILGSLRNAF